MESERSARWRTSGTKVGEWIVLVALGVWVAVEGVSAWSVVERVDPLVRQADPPIQPYRLQLDVNRASWQELTMVPGIGASTAQRIVAYRESNGPYQRVAELDAVRGVGPRSLERWAPFLYAGADHAETADPAQQSEGSLDDAAPERSGRETD